MTDDTENAAKVERLRAAVLEGMDEIASGRLYTLEEFKQRFDEKRAALRAQRRDRPSAEE